MLGVTRWAREVFDGRLHAVASVDMGLAEVRGYAEAQCGHRLPADVDSEDGPSGELCLPCVIGVTSDLEDPGRMGTAL
jgi:hypothetical protein